MKKVKILNASAIMWVVALSFSATNAWCDSGPWGYPDYSWGPHGYEGDTATRAPLGPLGRSSPFQCEDQRNELLEICWFWTTKGCPWTPSVCVQKWEQCNHMVNESYEKCMRRGGFDR